MSSFGDDLIQAMTEALAHAKGEGPAIVHARGNGPALVHDPTASRDMREQAHLTQARWPR